MRARSSPRALPAVAYHLAERDNWPSIEQHGLLSASRLFALAGIDARERYEIERRHRRGHLRLANGTIVRDQKPMPPVALARCLEAPLVPADWYALLNSKVFFWLDDERMRRQRQAFCASPQVLLCIDARALAAGYADSTAVTPINCGNARRAAARRGIATFVPYGSWLRDGWSSERPADATPRSDATRPAELTVADAVVDIAKYLIDVRYLPPGVQYTPSRTASLYEGTPARTA